HAVALAREHEQAEQRREHRSGFAERVVGRVRVRAEDGIARVEGEGVGLVHPGRGSCGVPFGDLSGFGRGRGKAYSTVTVTFSYGVVWAHGEAPAVLAVGRLPGSR